MEVLRNSITRLKLTVVMFLAWLLNIVKFLISRLLLTSILIRTFINQLRLWKRTILLILQLVFLYFHTLSQRRVRHYWNTIRRLANALFLIWVRFLMLCVLFFRSIKLLKHLSVFLISGVLIH